MATKQLLYLVHDPFRQGATTNELWKRKWSSKIGQPFRHHDEVQIMTETSGKEQPAMQVAAVKVTHAQLWNKQLVLFNQPYSPCHLCNWKDCTCMQNRLNSSEPVTSHQRIEKQEQELSSTNEIG